ncbi:MAG: CapA family protein [Candidatus Tectomicrobia bacterium]|uniref:CapA family protein n=1 Tax=Tectimicrobiota bacterium TaxID=2528274 RepID=A0A932ZUN5_UNCTE|nr:CapA family protein [Candidatus Tectomicrobia bacterium]
MTARASCAFLAGGDVALNRRGGGGAFGRLAPLFRRAGLAFANLECPLSRRGRGAPDKILLRGAPEMDEALLEAGFGLLSFANNHALDYGEEAFLDTLARMKERAIPLAGCGANLAQARRPIVAERKGLRIGCLAYCSILPRGSAAGPGRPGVNPLRAVTAYRPRMDPAEYPGAPAEVYTWTVPEDLQAMAKAVRALRRRVDVLVVNHHWGTSMTHEVRAFQREIAHAAVEAGADLVLGGHPHVLQGVELYKGTPIVYSMGNLIFDFDIPFFTEATRQTFLFGCTLSRRRAADPHLILCRSAVRNAPRPLSPAGGKGREILRLMERLCAPLGTRLRVERARVRVLPA